MAELISTVSIEPVGPVLSDLFLVGVVDVLVLLLAAAKALTTACSLEILRPLTVVNSKHIAKVTEPPSLTAVRILLDFAKGESFHCFLLIGC